MTDDSGIFGKHASLVNFLITLGILVAIIWGLAVLA
jgi:hypothetical protein